MQQYHKTQRWMDESPCHHFERQPDVTVDSNKGIIRLFQPLVHAAGGDSRCPFGILITAGKLHLRSINWIRGVPQQASATSQIPPFFLQSLRVNPRGPSDPEATEHGLTLKS